MGKNSFLLYIDSLSVLDELTNEQAGMLFKVIKAYQKGEMEVLDQLLSDQLIRVCFSRFRDYFEADKCKYENTCERRREAGSKGGKQKVANASNSKQMLASASNCKQSLANLADTDTDTDTDTDNSLSKEESVREGASQNFNSQSIKNQLLSDSTWKESICMQSTLGVSFISMLPDQIDKFIAHIISIGEEHTISNLSDAKRRFTYWWQNNGRKEVQSESKQEYIIPD